jgi:hypothetical protein
VLVWEESQRAATIRAAVDRVLEIKDTVGGLVRVEQTAASIYQHVLDGLGELQPRRLRSMQADHLLAAHVLRVSAENVRLDVLDPEVEFEVTPGFVASVVEIAAHRSRSPALEVLRQVEHGTLEEYEQALDEDVIDAGLRALVVDRLLPYCRAHIMALDAMLAV